MKPEEIKQNEGVKDENLTEQEKEQLEGSVNTEDLTSNTQNPDINCINCHGC